MPRVGVIGGSGVYELFKAGKSEKVGTPFGSVMVTMGTIEGEEVAFIPRHGEKHSIPPLMVNYKGNLYALSLMGVQRVIATNAVGSLREELDPGTMLIPDDFIDMTKSRSYTFYDGKTRISVEGRQIRGVAHVSMTPSTYCPEIRDSLLRASQRIGLKIRDGSTYACMEGNRFETPAEIRALRVLGGDVVGMTGCPEAALARELAICYATVNVVTNFAAGLKGSAKLSHEEVKEMFSERIEDVRSLIKETIPLMPTERGCACKDALKGALTGI